MELIMWQLDKFCSVPEFFMIRVNTMFLMRIFILQRIKYASHIFGL